MVVSWLVLVQSTLIGTTNSPERRSVGARSAGTLQVRDKKFEKGSVESTHKVPNSHYRTKHCHAAVVSSFEKGSVESTHKVPTSQVLRKGQLTDLVIFNIPLARVEIEANYFHTRSTRNTSACRPSAFFDFFSTYMFSYTITNGSNNALRAARLSPFATRSRSQEYNAARPSPLCARGVCDGRLAYRPNAS